jgi:hypothetical protein
LAATALAFQSRRFKETAMAHARRHADTEPPPRGGGRTDETVRGPYRMPPQDPRDAGPEDLRLYGADHPEVRRLDRLAEIMDGLFEVPGTNFRVGLDSLVGLIPAVGDTATAAVSGYIIYRCRKLGMPRGEIGKMIVWAGVDYVVGTVPVIGDLFDFGIKANRRNVDRLKAWAEKQRG